MNNNEESVTTSRNVVPPRVTALPIGLYEFQGLIYELYQGGRPHQPMLIHWERLKTVTVTREEKGPVDVHINQGR